MAEDKTTICIKSQEQLRLEAQMLLIRRVLGLSPIHDPVEAVRVLHDEGRAALDRIRGPRWEGMK